MGYLVHSLSLGQRLRNFDQLHQWQSVKALATLLITAKHGYLLIRHLSKHIDRFVITFILPLFSLFWAFLCLCGSLPYLCLFNVLSVETESNKAEY